jgi:CBS domain-containing protein
MDEPFSAIDAITREALQDELVRLQRAVRKTVLFVTHDVEEALRLADLIVVMRDGRVVQYDTPLAILARPADPFVAELVGADDMVRRLGLVRVDRVMAPLPPGFHADGLPAIGATDDVRHALSLLLRTGARTLVVREGDAPVGTLALEQILDAARVGAPASAPVRRSRPSRGRPRWRWRGRSRRRWTTAAASALCQRWRWWGGRSGRRWTACATSPATPTSSGASSRSTSR